MESAADERRRDERFATTRARILTRSGYLLGAEVFDESNGGIGTLVSVSDVVNLHSNQRIYVEHRRESRPAEIRYISPDGAGKHRVGIAWMENGEQEM